MPASNRWIKTTLTVLTATLLVADAAPLPQSSDMGSSSLQDYDTPSGSSSMASSSYTPSYTDESDTYSSGSIPLYRDEDDNTYPIAGSQWESDAQFSDLSSFSISNFSAGSQNIEVLAGSPSPPFQDQNDISTQSISTSNWDPSINSLRVTYPAGSMNPGNNPRGGSTFYAHPINMRRVHNATLEYSVFFPRDFDFVKGGKLPGLYGGHSGCAGGVDARDCFSTRMMWRENGHGELYLYAPRHRQTQRLCRSPPFSDCSTPYGLSIGRGSWTFERGAWTDIRQDVWLNTPGKNDGGFNIWINGKLVVHADDVFYRDTSETCLASMGNSAALWSGMAPFKRDTPSDDTDTFITEDWLSVTADADDQGLAIRSTEEPVQAVKQENSLVRMVKKWLGVNEKVKRAPFDDGHWKGINGYPGDPGYNGGSPQSIMTGTPGDVYTYQFTEVVTFPTALATATVTETITVTAAPEDPPADDPPAEKRNIKRQEVPEPMITEFIPTYTAGDLPAPTDPVTDYVPLDALTAADPEATDVAALKAPAKKPVKAPPPKPKVPVKSAPPKPPVKPMVPPKPVPPPAKPTPKPAPKPVVPPPKAPAPKAPAAKPAPPPPPPPPPAPKPPAPKAPAPVPPPPPPPPPPTPKSPTPPPPPPSPKAPGILLPVPHVESITRPHRHIDNVACERGFVGLFFSTFFGGHTETWASPKEQNTYFRNFRIRINS
ncbi:hypothetical protein V865_007870 [Kwoniella europaea PYCC6329]|uniref:Polysaccharide lyase 14 domain-containing protein n=1 Tax=Kwoniella europaea PYCC6329 TaxID=1423913 RepID=A0AAX4KV65_9TREE